jgi:hypothetical protein
MEGMGDAIEFGGLWDTSVRTENLESVRCIEVNCEFLESRVDKVYESLDDRVEVELRLLAGEEIPLHRELAFRTPEGIFLLLILLAFVEFADDDDDVPFAEPCLRCCWASCSRATWDGSLRDKNPRTELAFFFFFSLATEAESLQLPLLECVEARLGDVRLAVSEDGRERVEAVSAVEKEVLLLGLREGKEGWSAGSGFRYLSFGMRVGGDESAADGAMTSRSGSWVIGGPFRSRST